MQVLPYRYTPGELKELLKSIIVLVDSREQQSQHITSYFTDKKITYKSKKLDFADYSFILPANKDLGISRDIYFNNHICIERKANIEETSKCFAQDRARFEAELIRSQGAGSKLIILIEDSLGYEKIIQGNYRTKYNNRSFLGTLHTFKTRYDIDIVFIDPRHSGRFIFLTFYYFLREYLK